REIQHFIAELSEYIVQNNKMPLPFAAAQAEAMVTLVFTAGADALDMDQHSRNLLEERLVLQLRMIAKGAYWYRKEQEKRAIAQ
ncbi:MAG: HTH-type transcriptional repressor FabR, partial [Plesiomonas sp.]